jgi:Tfp pilus assembly protein PilX
MNKTLSIIIVVNMSVIIIIMLSLLGLMLLGLMVYYHRKSRKSGSQRLQNTMSQAEESLNRDGL